MNGVWIHHGCYKFNNADLALGPRDTTAHLPVFLHPAHHQLPGPPTASPGSEQARQKRLERKATKHERRQSRRRLTLAPASLIFHTAVA